jgi:DNA-binding response OmpR family regulator
MGELTIFHRNSTSVLVIEDNKDTAQNLKLFLDHQGYDCEIAYSGKQGLEIFSQYQPSLVLLDRMLPDMDGVFTCEQIRAQSDVPILMLTGKVSSHDLVEGLEAGADEYVKKPFNHTELMARINAHLRRTRLTSNDSFGNYIGLYQIDEAGWKIQFSGKLLKLTKTEYLLLKKLLERPGQVLSREQLFLAVFDHDADSGDRTVDVHLHNLRKKLLATGNAKHGIEAVYGVGYKLEI